MSMSEEHKKVLIDNRSYFVKNLYLSDVFSAVMREGNIITEEMEDEIKSHHTKGSRNASFLDLLARRGPYAFNQFIKALAESDQPELIKILDPDPIPFFRDNLEIREKIENDIPLIDETYLRKKSLVKNRTHMDLEYLRDGKKGRALIINIKFFKVHTQRDGSEKDADNLKRMFTLMGYDTTLVDTKLTKEEILSHLKDEQVLMNSNGFKYFVWILVVMSHGANKYFFSSDDLEIPIDEILLKFDGKNCQGLISVPKVAIFQCCRGDLKSQGLRCKNKELDVSSKLYETEATPAFRETLTQPQSIPVHEKSDFFVAYCTYEGYVSYRMTNLGCWYIRTIVYIFSRFCRHEDLQSMMTKVAEVVSGLKTDHSYIQMPFSSTTLKKKLYLL